MQQWQWWQHWFHQNPCTMVTGSQVRGVRWMHGASHGQARVQFDFEEWTFQKHWKWQRSLQLPQRKKMSPLVKSFFISMSAWLKMLFLMQKEDEWKTESSFCHSLVKPQRDPVNQIQMNDMCQIVTKTKPPFSQLVLSFEKLCKKAHLF